jgi:hypothetical protein
MQSQKSAVNGKIEIYQGNKEGFSPIGLLFSLTSQHVHHILPIIQFLSCPVLVSELQHRVPCKTSLLMVIVKEGKHWGLQV